MTDSRYFRYSNMSIGFESSPSAFNACPNHMKDALASTHHLEAKSYHLDLIDFALKAHGAGKSVMADQYTALTKSLRRVVGFI
jgi:hypothetical protein